MISYFMWLFELELVESKAPKAIFADHCQVIGGLLNKRNECELDLDSSNVFSNINH